MTLTQTEAPGKEAWRCRYSSTVMEKGTKRDLTVRPERSRRNAATKSKGEHVKPFFVYMLQCKDGSYYVGHTDDLERRMAQHHDGTFGGHVSRKRPVALVWSLELETREEALEREMQLKGWCRAKKQALIMGDWARVKTLARGPDRASGSSGSVRPSTSGRCAPLRAGRTDPGLRSRRTER